MPNDIAGFDKIIHHHFLTAYHTDCKRNLSSTCKVVPATCLDWRESSLLLQTRSWCGSEDQLKFVFSTSRDSVFCVFLLFRTSLLSPAGRIESGLLYCQSFIKEHRLTYSIWISNDFAGFDKIIHHHCVTAYHTDCKSNLSSTCKVYFQSFIEIGEKLIKISFPMTTKQLIFLASSDKLMRIWRQIGVCFFNIISRYS